MASGIAPTNPWLNLITGPAILSGTTVFGRQPNLSFTNGFTIVSDPLNQQNIVNINPSAFDYFTASLGPVNGDISASLGAGDITTMDVVGITGQAGNVNVYASNLTIGANVAGFTISQLTASTVTSFPAPSFITVKAAGGAFNTNAGVNSGVGGWGSNISHWAGDGGGSSVGNGGQGGGVWEQGGNGGYTTAVNGVGGPGGGGRWYGGNGGAAYGASGIGGSGSYAILQGGQGGDGFNGAMGGNGYHAVVCGGGAGSGTPNGSPGHVKLQIAPFPHQAPITVMELSSTSSFYPSPDAVVNLGNPNNRFATFNSLQITGSLTQTSQGNPYIIAQGAISIITNSLGQIILSGSGVLSSSIYADVSASYLVLSTNPQDVNSRVLTAGSGIYFTDLGAGSTLTISTSGSIVTVSGSGGTSVTNGGGTTFVVSSSVPQVQSIIGTGGVIVTNVGTQWTVSGSTGLVSEISGQGGTTVSHVGSDYFVSSSVVTATGLGGASVTSGGGTSFTVSASFGLISNLSGKGGTTVTNAGSAYIASSSIVTLSGQGGSTVTNGGGTSFTISSSTPPWTSIGGIGGTAVSITGATVTVSSSLVNVLGVYGVTASNGGGTSFTLQPRLRFIDVSAAPYNADTTGVADSTAIINQAINDAGEGGTVYFPAGNYQANYLTIPAYNVFTLQGDGPLNSTLVTHTTGVLVDAYTNSTERLVVNGLALQPTGSKQAGSQGIFASANSLSFINSSMKNFGIGLTGATSLTITDSSFVGCTTGSSIISQGNISTSVFNTCGVGIGVNRWTGAGNRTVSCEVDACTLISNTTAIDVWTGQLCSPGPCFFSSNTADIVYAFGSYGNDWSASGAGSVTDNDGGNTPPLMGPAVTTTGTISPTYRIFHLTGEGTLTNITPPENVRDANQPIVIYMFIDSVVSFTGNNGGAGQLSKSATYSTGQLVILLLDTVTSTWYLP